MLGGEFMCGTMLGGGLGGALMMGLPLADADGVAEGAAEAEGGGVAVAFTEIGTVALGVGVAVALTWIGSVGCGSGEFTYFGVSLHAAARVPKPTSAAPWVRRVRRSSR